MKTQPESDRHIIVERTGAFSHRKGFAMSPFARMRLVLVILACISCADTALSQASKGIKEMEKAGWALTFSDEFNGKALDRKKWIDSYPDNVRTHSNNEQQYYAEDGWQVGNGRIRFKA